jgi:hypothetical protein
LFKFGRSTWWSGTSPREGEKNSLTESLPEFDEALAQARVFKFPERRNLTRLTKFIEKKQALRVADEISSDET